ncbi:MAG TPA: hypothetical protein PK602_07120, partial [Methanothrix sp.]|nr:hypothetical protein [Methanothrix sp.]
AGAFQLGGDDISPVNRHRPKSMREGNINLIVATVSLELSIPGADPCERKAAIQAVEAILFRPKPLMY